MIIRTKWTRVLLLVAISLAVVPGGQHVRGQDSSGIAGELQGKTVWEGAVVLGGDVKIPSGSALHIRPGTEIRIHGNDSTRSGWNPDRIEIHVVGSLTIDGSEKQPVRFVPRRSSAGRGRPSGGRRYAWHGIILRRTEDRTAKRQIRMAIFKNAFAALQFPEGTAVIEDCVFKNCGTGVEVGSAYADRSRRGERGAASRPLIRRCRFNSCETGVFNELSGVPWIVRSVFKDCLVGAGNERRGLNYPAYPPGLVVDRCDFFGNAEGVCGPSLVSNSIFMDNRVALRPSAFHITHDTRVDTLAYRSNLFHLNRQIIKGESELGSGNVFKNPALVDRTASLDDDWPPLPGALALQKESPAIGCATDGGDLGAVGRMGTRGTEVTWQPVGATPRQVLLLGGLDLDEIGLMETGTVLKKTPAPGKRVKKAWWSATTPTERKWILLRECFGKDRAFGYMALRLQAEGRGSMKLEVNGDLSGLEVLWNRKKVYMTRQARRFGERGVVLEVKVKKGANHLLCYVAARGGNPRLGLSYAAPDDLGVSEASAPKPRSLKILSAKIVRDRRKNRFVEATVSSPISWMEIGVQKRIRLLTEDGVMVPGSRTLKVSLRNSKCIRLGPLGDTVKGKLLLSLTGMILVDGHAIEEPAEPRRVAGTH